MATNLLHCCICPKRPDFSDTSHLLTHVSSKGHLSHLHKLQVRSHQELSAGQQLVEYNQWFVDHNVAHLLSQRMLQKEKKQAKRKADNKHRLATSKRDIESEVDPNLLPDSKHLTIDAHGYAVADTSVYDELHHTSNHPNTSVYPSTPVPEKDERQYPTLHTRTDSSISDSSRSFDALQTQVEHIHGGSTPEMARLKGTIWPGMDIFDSADAETQRKRNQRKDVSVIERMRSMSERVEPMETVCSPGGTMKKMRHMDDMEDDSPVEGESPVVKQSSKRKRKVLAPISHNTSRLTLLGTRKTQTVLGPVSTPTKALPIVNETQVPDRLYSPLSMDPLISGIPPGHIISDRRRRQHFTVLNDQCLTSNNVSSSGPFVTPFLNTDRKRGRRESLISPPKMWMHSIQRSDHYEDPFKDFGSMHLMTDMYSPAIEDEEDVNPLAWQHNSKAMVHSPDPTPFGHLDDFDDTLEALAEVYAFTRNPLVGTPTQTMQIRTPLRKPPRVHDYFGQGTPAYR